MTDNSIWNFGDSMARKVEEKPDVFIGAVKDSQIEIVGGHAWITVTYHDGGKCRVRFE